MKNFDLGGPGQPLHFLHANGYPPDCYKPLFEFLKTEYHVFGMTLRPLWRDGAKPEKIQSWHMFSNDLLRFLSDFHPDPVIGVGHSIGATVTLRAALGSPGKFRALVLIDPVLFISRTMIAWNIVRALGIGDGFHPLIAGAKKRRRTFEDLETGFNNYRTKTIFRYMSDDNLRTYLKGITHQTPKGYELVYSPEWEIQIYHTGLRDFDIWRNLPNLDVPTLIIRGAETNTFLAGAARLIKQKQPKIKIEALPQSTHLLPLERPREVFEIMQSFLDSLP